MNDLESIIAAERRRGWFVTLQSSREGWTCHLQCGVDVLTGNIPRPSATGSTAMIALTLAIRERDRVLAERKAA